MVIYIAGPIEGNEDYMKDFLRAEAELVGAGFIVENPAVYVNDIQEYENKKLSRKKCIDIGLSLLKSSDAIYLLRGWRRSQGATLEAHYAEVVGIPVFEETDPMTQAMLEVERINGLGY